MTAEEVESQRAVGLAIYQSLSEAQLAMMDPAAQKELLAEKYNKLRGKRK